MLADVSLKVNQGDKGGCSWDPQALGKQHFRAVWNHLEKADSVSWILAGKGIMIC